VGVIKSKENKVEEKTRSAVPASRQECRQPSYSSEAGQHHNTNETTKVPGVSVKLPKPKRPMCPLSDSTALPTQRDILLAYQQDSFEQPEDDLLLHTPPSVSFTTTASRLTVPCVSPEINKDSSEEITRYLWNMLQTKQCISDSDGLARFLNENGIIDIDVFEMFLHYSKVSEKYEIVKFLKFLPQKTFESKLRRFQALKRYFRDELVR
jgi:hypothetical protein